MLDKLGFSVYISNYEELKERLLAQFEPGTFLFTSFHIPEEMDGEYIEKCKTMCRELKAIGYEIIADVSRRTLAAFQKESLSQFAADMGITILRIDYGFTEAEMVAAGRNIPLCLNASTVDEEMSARLASQIPDMLAMHNFYPRPETGLDEELFHDLNRSLNRQGIPVFTFIPGDGIPRGPLYETLPTLEIHRKASPYACYIDLQRRSKGAGIFVGDGLPSDYELDRIRSFEKEGLVEIPVVMAKDFEYLLERTFTIRPDSPRWAKRLSESREYATPGPLMAKGDCEVRRAGSVTMDNEGYGRYSGEIQIVTETLPADERVNVIGRIPQWYQLLWKNIRNGDRIRLIKAEEGGMQQGPYSHFANL